jgi:hypothetical protein
MARADPETQLQIAAVNLMRLILPEGAMIHHSHNEGKRSKREAGIAKAMGQRAGFADVMILYCREVYFIEFKSPTGRQSASQKDFQIAAAIAGFPNYAIARSIDDTVAALRQWGLEARKVGNVAY